MTRLKYSYTDQITLDVEVILKIIGSFVFHVGKRPSLECFLFHLSEIRNLVPSQRETGLHSADLVGEWTSLEFWSVDSFKIELDRSDYFRC
ncbi:hypothetical protein [Carnobacterium sp.]|uniref:hypothetical protein n=1 Tax=Carnobacterium sp. TaxID=48221 RepID=UPI003C78CF79